MIVFTVAGLAAGLGLAKLLFELFGALPMALDAHASERNRRVVWVAWVVRLAVVAPPAVVRVRVRLRAGGLRPVVDGPPAGRSRVGG
ncbi:hypothetical protein D7319_08395 [Streptomyces radicis]|uniref:Uncharacterized protein n=1 Tax=Streptomyces radicis TaxID=1750517 RepID=A0A3A9WRN7_9ACTN|nr:hypothetical protein [Streptomyces radicis]RKN10446.1 hypothetical protein D7319_08395 [Streptomyces radicis]RKN24705.1 hypothetical protein D7318_09570 [Streptomyces radicis]